MVWVVPFLHPTNVFGISVLFLGISGIAYAMGRFLAGDSDRMMLVVVGLIIAALVILFSLTPVSL